MSDGEINCIAADENHVNNCNNDLSSFINSHYCAYNRRSYVATRLLSFYCPHSIEMKTTYRNISPRNELV